MHPDPANPAHRSPDPSAGPTGPVPHMSAAEFRQRGRAVIDLIADYLETVESRPVLSTARPGQVLAALPTAAPEHPEPFDAVLADFDRIILPALTHWQSPNFFAFFPADGSYPAILGDLLASGLGVNGMLWATSPACTELETRVLDWLARAIGLPESFCRQPAGTSDQGPGGGVIQSTASECTLVALLAARHRVRAASPTSARGEPVLYTSPQAHSSVIKAAMIAGLADGPDDRRLVRLIDIDDDLAMRPAALASAIAADRAAGLTPAFVCATLGTTGTTAIDRLADLGPIARANHLWLHVDAAYLGAQFICPEHRAPLAGVEHADSFCFNPHKWLLTNFDCSCFWTRNAAALTSALSINPDYLRNVGAANAGAARVIDYRDWQIPLGRRFRALKLWMVIRHYGLSGLRAFIREHLRLAEAFERRCAADPRFEITAPRTSALVCFRLRPRAAELPAATDARNRALLDRLNATGQIYLTHTTLPPTAARPHPALTLRLAIGSTRTEARHVLGDPSSGVPGAWDKIAAAADAVS